MVLLALWLGCSAGRDPLAPPEGIPSRWYVVDVGASVAGIEERRVTERAVWRRRTQRFLVDGEVTERTATSRVALGPSGEVLRYDVRDDEGLRSWSTDGEPTYLLDLTYVVGEVRALDPTTLHTERVAVAPDGWTLGGVRWTRFGEVLIVGPIVIRPVDAEPALEGVDPAAALRRPAPRLDRRARWASFEVDGAERIVEVPLAAEIPSADRDHLARLVRVDRDGDCQDRAAQVVDAAGAEGLAARVVEGLVYLADPQPGLVPHAWVEVHLGARWVAIDPALDQPLADATHLPLEPGETLASSVTLRAWR